MYSYRAAYDDTGFLAVYAGTAPDRVDETLGVVDGELDRLVADGGITADELDAAKGHLTGSLALSLETLGQPDAPHRPHRAEVEGEVPIARRARRARRRASPPTTSRGSIDRVLPRRDRGRSPSSARTRTADFASAPSPDADGVAASTPRRR